MNITRFVWALALTGVLGLVGYSWAQQGGGIQGGITNLGLGTVTGTLAAGNGGTGQTSATDDSVLLGNGTAFAVSSIQNCTDTRGQHLNYTTSTNSFSCGTSGSLVGTSSSLGGGALLAGACDSNTTTVTGATTAMAAIASPVTYPGDGTMWSAQVTATNTVTTRVCAIIAATPTASTYNIRVIQ